MPIWSEILTEINETLTPEGTPDFDKVRRQYLLRLHKHTGRNTILYGSAWLQKPDAPPSSVTINDEDMQAFMENVHSLEGDELDLFLHSPGGSLESAEHIVSYLRSRFSHIRVIVPQLAMSAATLICCAADKIVMGKHSSLGPIDPQLILPVQSGQRRVAAQTVLDQFHRAQEEMAEPKKMAAWYPMLSQYGPDLIVLCENSVNLSKLLSKEWLSRYMFKCCDNKSERAKNISDWLSDHKNFKSHGRHILRPDLEAKGLVIERLEEDETLQDLALSVYHAVTHTFTNTHAIKIVENHLGRAFVKLHRTGPTIQPPEQALDQKIDRPSKRPVKQDSNRQNRRKGRKKR